MFSMDPNNGFLRKLNSNAQSPVNDNPTSSNNLANPVGPTKNQWGRLNVNATGGKNYGGMGGPIPPGPYGGGNGGTSYGAPDNPSVGSGFGGGGPMPVGPAGWRNPTTPSDNPTGPFNPMPLPPVRWQERNPPNADGPMGGGGGGPMPTPGFSGSFNDNPSGQFNPMPVAPKDWRSPLAPSDTPTGPFNPMPIPPERWRERNPLGLDGSMSGGGGPMPVGSVGDTQQPSGFLDAFRNRFVDRQY